MPYSDTEFICPLCDYDDIEKLSDVNNIKLVGKPFENVPKEEDKEEEDFKNASTKLWGAFLFRKRVKYEIGDAIFVRNIAKQQEKERLEKYGNYHAQIINPFSIFYL